MLLHLDLETFSHRPIADGTHAYLRDPTTKVIMLQWAIGRGEVREHDAGGAAVTPPRELADKLADPQVLIVCFNAEFERLAVKYLLGFDLPPERFLCTMALAWSMSFAGSLEQVGVQMGLAADKQKIASARRIMLKLTKPRRPSKKNPATQWTDENAPEDWDKFRDYGKSDVVASREIFDYVWKRAPWSDTERRTWCMDQRINDRGWPVDEDLVRNANAVRQAEEARLTFALDVHTGLDNPNSGPQFHGWLNDRLVFLDNLQKETVAEALKQPELDEEVRYALTLYRELQRTTPKKWDALERATVDGRIQATLEYAAAQRTGRWGGRIFQPQNLYSARGWEPEELLELAELLTHADRDTIEALYGDVMDALRSCIRQAVTAPPGSALVVVDKASIESRLLGWFADCERIQGIFTPGKQPGHPWYGVDDTYKDLASRLFGVPYAEVTKAQRNYSKPPDLGCGYMLGRHGLVKYAASMGQTMDEDQAHHAVTVWRSINPEVTRLWDWLQEHVAAACQHLHHQAQRDWVHVRREHEFLTVQLPSGRKIYYYRPGYELGADFARRSGFPVVEGQLHRRLITYEGRSETSWGRWGPVMTHPGKLVENWVQACARDDLVESMLEIERQMPWARLVGHVHDEVVLEVPEFLAEEALDMAASIMSTSPAWAPGLHLGAEGFITERYMKG